MPRRTVIIPAYNAASTVAACVGALSEQAERNDAEIVVVDDGSTDETADRARAAGARVIRCDHRGTAAARNTGIQAARGEIICCTDADCVPRPDWLEQIVAPLADPQIAAAKGTYVTLQRALVARFVQLEYEDKYDLMRGRPSIDFVDTYSAAYRRDALLAVGGFDTHFTYAEDQELSFRLAKAGRHMVFQPSAVVAHLHASTLHAYIRKKLLIGYWKAQVMRRHPERLARDSHTPQVMKIQMGLSGLVIGAAGLAAVAGLAGLDLAGPMSAIAAALIMVFLFTTLPFAVKAWRKDRAVALASPPLLFVRAVALAAGYGWGIVRPAAIDS